MVSIPVSTQVPAKLPRIVVYLPEDIKADLEKLAASQHRPVSNMVLALIAEAIKDAKEKGLIKDD